MDKVNGPLSHLMKLTDDTGILEHALGAIPRRNEGYSTDDQARALWLCIEWLDLEESDKTRLLNLCDTYLSFLLWVQKDNGHFHNNIAYDRSPEPENPSDDCLGRCLWALALAATRLDEARQLAAETMLNKALERTSDLRHPRGQAYALAALAWLIQNGREELKRKAEPLIEQLIASYQAHRKENWRWFEPLISYSNAVIPWGLLCTYEWKRDERVLRVATEALDFLIDLCTSEQGHIRPVGNRGWCTPSSRAIWDQQPIDVMKLFLASVKAFELTDNEQYARVAEKCRKWFYGENDLGVRMGDPVHGRCYDGLEQDGPNQNMGAESTLSFLLTEVMYKKVQDRIKPEKSEAEAHLKS